VSWSFGKREEKEGGGGGRKFEGFEKSRFEMRQSELG